MKKILPILVTLVLCTYGLNAQETQDPVGNCSIKAGENTTFMKDIKVQLPEASENSKENPVHKVNIILAKNMNYRFTMCNADLSEGELFITLYEKQKEIISSYAKSGTIYSALDFACNKTGMYQLWFSFKDGIKGSGVGIVSLVK
jgi:hypothetical protein